MDNRPCDTGRGIVVCGLAVVRSWLRQDRITGLHPARVGLERNWGRHPVSDPARDGSRRLASDRRPGLRYRPPSPARMVECGSTSCVCRGDVGCDGWQSANVRNDLKKAMTNQEIIQEFEQGRAP